MWERKKQGKWIVICLTACFFASFTFGGCAKDSGQGQEKAGGKWGFSKGEGTVIEDIDFSFLAEEENSWRDNALDAWQGVVNLHLEMEELQGENEYALGMSSTANRGIGYGYALLSENGAFYVRDPGYDSRLEDTLIEGISSSGEKLSARLKGQGIIIGAIAGEADYVAVYRQKLEDKGYYCFYRLDENFQKTGELWVEDTFGGYAHVNRLMGDGKGNLHMIIPAEGGSSRYLILSPEGKTLFDQEAPKNGSFCSLGDGRVGLRQNIMKQVTFDYQFWEADLEAGELREIALFDSTKIKNPKDRSASAVALKNEKEFIWVGAQGIYRYDMEKDEEELLYQWNNHGIVPDGYFGAEYWKDGSFGILYLDTEGLNYLLLRPTEKREEVQTLTIAISPKNRGIYEGAVTYFSKRHPEYTILLKDDYDQASLLTQLGAGQGPIIIDTALTGFEELERLWQPLDGFLEKSGVLEELIPEALEFGKIGDRTYGLVTSFYIQTMLIKDEDMSDWDYEGFLKYVEKFEGDTVFSYNYLSFLDGLPNFQQLFFDFLQNGLYDTYYVNLEEESLLFGTDQFDSVLGLSQKAKKGIHSTSTGVELIKGEVACEIYDIINFHMLAELRERVQDGGARLIGCPTKEGGRSFLMGGDPVVIRSTCTEEEKKVAYTFLRDMLTKEVQSAPIKPSAGTFDKHVFPIRKDVLEKKFQEYDESAAIGSIQEKWGKVSEEEYRQLQIEATEEYKQKGLKDREFFWELLRKAKVRKSFPTALENVYLEELEDYMAGRIDEKMVSEHLQKRFRLYLEETR